jgi:hypothetical protein
MYTIILDNETVSSDKTEESNASLREPPLPIIRIIDQVYLNRYPLIRSPHKPRKYD